MSHVRRIILPLVFGCWTVVARAQVPLPDMESLHGASSIVLSQEVVVSVAEIDAVSVDNTEATLTINDAVPGSGPTDATHTGTTYSLTTNGSNKKLTGTLSAAYSTGIALYIELTAPDTGTSEGEVEISAGVSKDLVTGFSKLAQSNIPITYRASATFSAGPNGAGETRTVTLTLTDM